jgi:UDP-3-O-[3-hydroxymyristoyl] glucosamine N-acyltransferase
VKKRILEAIYARRMCLHNAVVDTLISIYDAERVQSLLTSALNVFVPRHIVALQPDAFWRRHKNGGGWVSSTAAVAQTAYVGYSACVYDSALVVDYARIEDRARVFGSARVGGKAQVCHDACVMGVAHISGTAYVCHNARLFDVYVADNEFIMIGQIKPGSIAL